MPSRGVLGGPAPSGGTLLALGLAGAAAPAAVHPVDDSFSQAALLGSGSPVEGTLADAGTLPGFSAERANVFSYAVKRGDTLSEIASTFGISVQTIVSANPQVKSNSLRVGDNLRILPVSGALYSVRDGDTLESVAEYFGVPAQKILEVNQGVKHGELSPGAQLVIPGAKLSQSSMDASNGSLPRFKGYFIMPAAGYDLGVLHPHNAVDIAGICGTPVVAAASGLVVPDDVYGDGTSGWNGGYGNFVLIEHPVGAGVLTRYAHLDQVLVSVGDYVDQGQQIGTMGQTGDAASCHVHFEVYGAQNPFAK